MEENIEKENHYQIEINYEETENIEKRKRRKKKCNFNLKSGCKHEKQRKRLTVCRKEEN